MTHKPNRRMKKYISVIFLVAGMWTTSASGSEPYVNAFVGKTVMNHVGRGHKDSGLTMLGAIGLGFENNCRIEAEVGYQTVGNNGEYGSTIDSDMPVLSILVNAYYDISFFDIATPYITAGVGETNVYPMGITIPDALQTSKTSLAYQLGTGITVPIGDNVKVDARYRYFVTPKVILDPAFDNQKLSSSSFLLGLRFNL